MEVPSGPLVRSSYRADRVFEKNNLGLAEPAAVPGQGTSPQLIPTRSVS